jgi:hypothetical protein
MLSLLLNLQVDITPGQSVAEPSWYEVPVPAEDGSKQTLERLGHRRMNA